MKYVFGINVTDDANNERLDGEALIEKEADSEQISLLTELAELEQTINSYAPKPDRRKPFGKLCGLWAVVTAACVILALVNGSVKINDPTIVFGIVLAAVLGGIFVYNVLIKKPAEAPKVPEEDTTRYKKMTAEAEENAKKQFGIPDNAAEMDVLSFMYTEKDGKFKVFSRLGVSIYLNNPKKVFVKDGKLCFADLTTLFSIPMDTMGDMRMVDKTINLPWWNKENPYNSAKFASFRIRPNNLGTLSVKTYYEIPFTSDANEDFILCIPPYEAETFEKIMSGRR